MTEQEQSTDNAPDATARLIELVNERNSLNSEIATLKNEAEDYKAKISDLEKALTEKEANETRLQKMVFDNVIFKDKPDSSAEDAPSFEDAYNDLMNRMNGKKD